MLLIKLFAHQKLRDIIQQFGDLGTAGPLAQQLSATALPDTLLQRGQVPEQVSGLLCGQRRLALLGVDPAPDVGLCDLLISSHFRRILVVERLLVIFNPELEIKLKIFPTSNLSPRRPAKD